ncbi:PWWP domain-containing protein 2A-like [Plodia interpunctella]|uniref:PWWP domain-containing protein 2A-like n=1 Tax=Plodia interpunctella TaxID=58824 RepID=UPI002367F14F|nr:PWWP domain-containing protein 2A-like [Plodia interpunctella]
MAAVASTADNMTIQKNSKILVNVEEALADLIVVSYCSEDKNFQGVLLDSNKGNLPFGVYGLHPAFTKKPETVNSENDKLHSISQRFIYQEPGYSSENIQKSKKPGPKAKPQRQKMTVRLRPRKVLCSNCQGICNDNSENVDVSKKRKFDSDDDTVRGSTDSSNVKKKYLMGGMLIPKLSRLHPHEITTAIKGSKINKASEKSISKGKGERSSNDEQTPEVAFVSVSESDLSDKHMKDENENGTDASFSSMFSSARTLKICFGEGEGTVVKIPPLSGDFNEDSGVSCDMNKPPKPDLKAAKKAMKRAKKQAKKNNADKINTESWQQSPKHIGALSPRNNMSINQPILDPLEKKHKHKVKHKKKQKKRDENMSKSNEESMDYFSDIKVDNFDQKLSISLRRLSGNSYERPEEDNVESGSEDWEEEVVPDFPETATESSGGKVIRVAPGDIVWGKVVGFPWWPGRILSVTSDCKAHVAWYASTTSSLMPCDSLSPFLEDYKIRFNKKKRGPYKEAVKQATIEAKRIESHTGDPLASPTHQNLSTMSPRPIDVFS